MRAVDTPRAITWNRAVDRFLAQRQREGRIAPNTAKAYRVTLGLVDDDFKSPEMPLMPTLFEPPAGTAKLEAFVGRHWGTGSSSSRRRVWATLASFFQWCAQEGIMHGDPTRAVTRPTPGPASQRTIPDEVVDLIRDGAARRSDPLASRDRLALAVLFELGPTKGELQGIRLGDYNRGTGELTLRRGTKARQGEMSIGLQSEFERYVDERLASVDTTNPRAVDRVLSEHLLFPTGPRTGARPTEPLSERLADGWWRRQRSQAKVGGYTLSDARRSARSGNRPSSAALQALRSVYADTPAEYKGYLEDAVGCFAHGLYRPAILMTWAAVMGRLYDAAEREPGGLGKLGAEHANRFSGGKNYRPLRHRSQFGDVTDSAFLDLARDVGMFNRNLHKLLSDRLHLRNLCAHASGFEATEGQARDFIEVLARNVFRRGGMLLWDRAT